MPICIWITIYEVFCVSLTAFYAGCKTDGYRNGFYLVKRFLILEVRFFLPRIYLTAVAQIERSIVFRGLVFTVELVICLLYTSDAADE